MLQWWVLSLRSVRPVDGPEPALSTLHFASAIFCDSLNVSHCSCSVLPFSAPHCPLQQLVDRHRGIMPGSKVPLRLA